VSGTVHLAGAGPGAPDLLTVRAARLLGEAIVLVGQGARDPAWAAPLERLADALRERGHLVRLAFLEFMAPNLSTTLDALYRNGTRSVRIVPVFLGAGGHVVRDVGEQVAAARALRPDLRVAVEPPVGERAEVVEAIARAIAGEVTA
jgi:sirohydrochlorin cobaltochelatase